MKVTFWGVRGSIPTPLTEGDVKEKMYRLLSLINSSDDTSTVEGRDKVLERFTESEPLLIGGNTSCIEVQADDKTLIFDMGSGIRRLGNHIAEDSKRGREIHIFLSHTHWDHINGFPFFLPAYLPDYKLHFYSIHPGLKEKLEIQQDPRFFPVKLEQMSSTKEFFQLKEDCELMVGDILIKNKQLFHPGNSYGYSVNVNGKKFVFATDSEYKVNSTEIMESYISFFQDADLLVFDSQYTFVEALHKANWGHSSAIMGIDIAVQAKAKKIILFHHEPDNDDRKLIKMLEQARLYKSNAYPESELEVLLAREGMTFEL